MVSCVPAIADAELHIDAAELFPDVGGMAPTGAGDTEAAEHDDFSDGGRGFALSGRSRGPARVSFAGCCWVAGAAREAQHHYDHYAAAVRPFFECPAWLRELAGPLPWHLRFGYRVRRGAHINVLAGVATLPPRVLGAGRS